MRLSLNLIPEEIKPLVQIMGLAEDGYVYLEIWKGMDGLPQDGMLANNQLTKHLATYGYSPTSNTPGLWRHQTSPIFSSLW